MHATLFYILFPRDALLSTGGGDSTYVNPWFVSEDQAANLTTDEFRRMQEEVIKGTPIRRAKVMENMQQN